MWHLPLKLCKIKRIFDNPFTFIKTISASYSLSASSYCKEKYINYATSFTRLLYQCQNTDINILVLKFWPYRWRYTGHVTGLAIHTHAHTQRILCLFQDRYLNRSRRVEKTDTSPYEQHKSKYFYRWHRRVPFSCFTVLVECMLAHG